MSYIDRDMFSGYEIYEEIGKGGGGSIYKAFHKNLEKEVVIKKLHNTMIDPEKQKVEAKILKNLRHTFLPQVFDYIIKDNCAYTVMDYISGDSIGNYLKKGRIFKNSEVIQYSRELCEVVAYLHSQNPPIIHGDIKPDNIMITKDNHICLIDFNISGISEGGVAYTDGYTPGYSAPEQYYQFKELYNKMHNLTVAVRKDELSIEDDKTEVINQDDDKTEVINQDDDKTEVIGPEDDDKTEVIIGANSDIVFDDDKTEVAVYGASNSSSPLIGEIRFQENGNVKDCNRIAIDKRSDVYSIGATIYHMYANKKYSKNNNQLPSDTSDVLIYILNKALSENPQHRYKDAGEMFKSFQQFYKNDKKYKKLVFTQAIIRLFLVMMLVLGIFLIRFGYDRTLFEKEETYKEALAVMDKAIVNGDEKKLQEAFQNAIEIYPERVMPYYKDALYMYYYCDKEETLYQINEWLENAVFLGQSDIGNIYHIQGDIYFDLELYKEADAAYKNALKTDVNNAQLYTNDAIVWARMGETDKAKTIIEKGIEAGASNDAMHLAQGEIAYAEGDYIEAIEFFDECIDETQDDYVKLRAGIVRSKCYEALGNDKDTIMENIKGIDDVLSDIPINTHGILLERKAQVAINASLEYYNEGYEEIAINALEEIVKSGSSSFQTYSNLVVINERIDDFDEAKKILSEMEEKYPDDYRVYLRYCLLEADYQSEQAENIRDYSKFEDYYHKMMKIVGNNSIENDTEILKVKDVYLQLIDNKWLEEE